MKNLITSLQDVKQTKKGSMYGCVLSTVFLILMSSCISNKKVVYFQNRDEISSLKNDSLINPPKSNYQLLVGDIIDVRVKSKDPVLSEFFIRGQVPGMQQNMMQGLNNGSDIFYLSGYTINAKGDIELPIIGAISVAGRTLNEVEPIIKSEIAKYIIDPYVEVKLGGVRFTALGEFARPGRYGILQNDVTIYEAIANAGDLTVLADRKHALLIRQYPDGERTHEIDLTQREVMNTPFYYIQPNDLLYLPPLKVRELGTGQNGAQTFATMVSALTALALIINLFGN